MTRLLSTLLLTAACAVAATAQQPSRSDSSTAPSPAATSAAGNPSPQDDDLLRSCELCAARLRAAEARVASLEAIIADKDRQLQAKEELLQIRAQVIAELKQVDARSQQMDANAIRADAAATAQVGLLREQIGRDALRISELQGDLDGCRGGQKWIALGSAFGGGLVGYKIRGAQQAGLLPFGFTNGLPAFTLQPQAPAGLQFTRPPDAARTLEQLRRVLSKGQGAQ